MEFFYDDRDHVRVLKMLNMVMIMTMAIMDGDDSDDWWLFYV